MSKRDRKIEAIDLEQTKVVASGQGPVTSIPDRRGTVRETLMADLSEVEDGSAVSSRGVGVRGRVQRLRRRRTGVVVDQSPPSHVNDGRRRDHPDRSQRWRPRTHPTAFSPPASRIEPRANSTESAFSVSRDAASAHGGIPTNARRSAPRCSRTPRSVNVTRSFEDALGAMTATQSRTA